MQHVLYSLIATWKTRAWIREKYLKVFKFGIFKVSYGNRVEGLDWIHLDHDNARWRALVNAVMNEPSIA
jgi:hypothetical protein